MQQSKQNQKGKKMRTIIENWDAVSANIDESYIVTTEDKAKLLYKEVNEVAGIKGVALGWLGILVTLIIADLTCDFKSIWKLSSECVRAIFIVGTVVIFVLLIGTGKKWFNNKNKLEYDFFIQQLRGNEGKNGSDDN